MRRLRSVFLLAAALGALGCSTTDAQGPACTNESSVRPYSDAGVLPPRALSTGFPCADNAICYATIDDCPGDWPDASAVPASANATPFECDCLQGVWACEAEDETPPVCAPISAPLDAGAG